MFKETYQDINDRLEPSEALIRRTLAAAQPRRRAILTPRRGLAFALVLVLCLMVGTSALAAASPEFNGWLYTISPDWALYFRPVQISCEDQGIRMEVQGIHIDGGTAEIYVTLQDLIGDRLDATIDLFDSYALDTKGDSSAYCRMIAYNEATRTATFYIHYESSENIRSDKLTFTIRQLLTKKERTEGLIEGFGWELLSKGAVRSTDTPLLRGAGYSGSSFDMHAMSALVPGDALLYPVEGVELTGVSYIGDMLHIQMYYHNIRHTDNHGFLWLKDDAGDILESKYNLSMWDDDHQGSYEDYAFAVSPDDLSRYQLYGDFTTCEFLVEGDWSVTFPITDM